MSDKTETPKILEEISKSTNPKSGGRSSRSQQNARRRFLIIVVLFIPVLAALAYLAYFQMNVQAQIAELQQQNAQLGATVASYESEIASLDVALNAIPEQVQSDDSATRELASRLDTELAAVAAQLAAVQAEQTESSSAQSFAWKILEADYLVRLANRKLQLEGDSLLAIELLEQADAALLESGSSNILGSRQAIADDLSLLRSTTLLDREGLYIRLENLSGQVDSLDLLTSMREDFQRQRGEESEPVTIGAESSGVIDSSLEFLGSVFVWRRWEDSPQAMLAPGQEGMILQNLRLIIEQTKLALMASDNGLYGRSLTDGIEWLRRYAVIDSASGQRMLQEMTELQGIDIDPPIPELVRSTTAMQQLAASVR